MAKYVYIHCVECGKNRRHHARGLCKPCYRSQHYAIHREKSLERGRQYYQEHGEELREYSRKYREDHPGYISEYMREWRAVNPGRDREYREANPERRRAYARRYRARKHNATIEPVDEAAIYELFGHTCIYCGGAKDLALDHVVPLARGGPHCEDNLIVACGRCNSSKGASPLEAWLRTQPKALIWVM